MMSGEMGWGQGRTGQGKGARGGKGRGEGEVARLMSRGGGGVPYQFTYPMMYLKLPTPPSREQTDACESITFPKLRLWR